MPNTAINQTKPPFNAAAYASKGGGVGGLRGARPRGFSACAYCWLVTRKGPVLRVNFRVLSPKRAHAWAVGCPAPQEQECTRDKSRHGAL